MYQIVVCASSPTYYQNCIAHNILPTVFMLYSNKEYINAVKQVVKIFEDGIYLFHCSYFSAVQVSRGSFASRSQ